MLRPFIHMVLHLLVPGIVARFFFRERWRWAWLVMCLTMVVDVDHLLADPVYDPDRCGIGFHLLHTYPAILIYGLMIIIPILRWVGTGLIVHMILDGVDCLWIYFE